CSPKVTRRPARERQTVRDAPKYAENSIGRSARVGRGAAEFTSAGRGGACRPYETRPERRPVKPIGVLAGVLLGSAFRRVRRVSERSSLHGSSHARHGDPAVGARRQRSSRAGRAVLRVQWCSVLVVVSGWPTARWVGLGFGSA